MQLRWTAAVIVAVTLAVVPLWAADGTRVENKLYKFAFTFEAGTELTFEDGGVGIAGSHLPTGARKADYGVLVYGSPGMHLSAAEAKAAKLGEAESVLQAQDVADAAKWAELYPLIMEARGVERAGEARVNMGDSVVKVPYYAWEQNVLGRTHHAFMYVVKHGDAFVYVQVESNTPLSAAQREWMATKLELLPQAD